MISKGSNKKSLPGYILGAMLLLLAGAFFQIVGNLQSPGEDSGLAMITLHPSITLLFPVTGNEDTPTPENMAIVPSDTLEPPPALPSDTETSMVVLPSDTETVTPEIFVVSETPTPTYPFTETPSPTWDNSATATGSQTVSPTVTNTPTVTQTETPTSSDITWNVEIAVPVTSQELSTLGGVSGAENEIQEQLDSEISDQAVDSTVDVQSSSSSGATFKVSVAGEDGLDQFRQTIFGDLNSQIDLLGGAVNLEISGDVISGQAFPLLLESNPSTGYTWEVLSYDSSLLQVITETEYDQKVSQVGAPGVQTVRFIGIGNGPTTITLFYGRPWMANMQVTRNITIDTGSIPLDEAALDLSSSVENSITVENPVVSSESTSPTVGDSQTVGLPTSFDWRAQGLVTTIRDQGSCGSCWAFATVGVMEAAIKIQGGGDVNLSEQYLVSCNNSNYSCSGGWWAHAYHINRYISPQTEAGAVLESAFPYTASNSSCSQAFSHPYKLTNWVSVAGDYSIASVDQIKNAIYNYGPVASAICVGSSFNAYRGGVFSTDETSTCNGGINHAIVLTGWDDATQTWVLRNSWGSSWGENGGYMRIKWGTSMVGYAANYVLYAGSGTPTPGPSPTATPSPTPTATIPPATNDNIDNATTITLTNNAYSTVEDISTANKATDDPTLPCSSRAGYKSVWFRYTSPAGGIFSVDTIGSDYDTILGVWSGTRGSLSNLACDDDSGGNYKSKISSVTLSAGQTVYIEVVSYSLVTSGVLRLNVSEVNIALGKSVSQSTTFGSLTGAAKSIDNNTSGYWADSALSSTNSEYHPWWQVDLGAVYSLTTIKLWNRTDCCSDRLSNFYILVSDTPFSSTDLNTAKNQSGVSNFYFSGSVSSSTEISINRSGRYVRVQLSGTNYLTLAEVQVLSSGLAPAPSATATPTITATPTNTSTPPPGGANIALGKSVSQSTTFGSLTGAAKSIDNNTSGYWADSALSSTNSEYHPWWQVDLGAVYSLTTIKLWNRTDCCSDRLSNFYILVSDTPFSSTDLNTAKNQSGVSNFYFSGSVSSSTEISINRSGRYVRVQLSGTNYLTLAEVQVLSSGLAPAPSATATPTITATPTNTSTPPPGGANIALGKSVSQSTTFGSLTGAAKSIDNNTSGYWADSALSSTNSEYHPWWQVDLGAVYSLTTIKLWNRTDCCSDRLSNFYILVSDTPFSSTDLNTAKNQSGVSNFYFSGSVSSSTEISINRSGRYVRVQLSGTNYLTLAEVQILSSGLAPAPSATATPTITATPTNTSTPPPGGANIALGKSVSQSTTFGSLTGAAKSIDNNTSGYWADSALSSTNSEYHPWWQVDLGAVYSLTTIKLWNRTDCCSDRLSNFYILVSDTPFSSTDLNTAKNQSGVSNFYFSGSVSSSTEISINRSGRYVRVQLSGTNYLTLAEVQILSSGLAPAPTPTPTSTPLPGGTNIALGKTASQSTTLSITTGADKSIDNNTSGLWSDNVLSSTKNEATPWWQVDLGNIYSIGTVKVWNRTDCCSDRLSNFYVFVSDTPFTSTNLNTTKSQSGVSSYYFNGPVGSSTEISINRSGRYVRVQLSGTNYLSIAEVQVLSSGVAQPQTITNPHLR